MVAANEDKVRQIVREETDDIRVDLKGFQKTVSEVVMPELTRLGVFMEALESKMDTVLELLSGNFKTVQSVENHEQRITDLEAGYKLTASTVALHSRRFKLNKLA